MEDTGGQWLELRKEVTVDPGSQSAWCTVELVNPLAAVYAAHVDQLRLGPANEVIFSDGFESGNTTAWSQTVP